MGFLSKLFGKNYDQAMLNDMNGVVAYAIRNYQPGIEYREYYPRVYLPTFGKMRQLKDIYKLSEYTTSFKILTDTKFPPSLYWIFLVYVHLCNPGSKISTTDLAFRFESINLGDNVNNALMAGGIPKDFVNPSLEHQEQAREFIEGLWRDPNYRFDLEDIGTKVFNLTSWV